MHFSYVQLFIYLFLYINYTSMMLLFKKEKEM